MTKIRESKIGFIAEIYINGKKVAQGIGANRWSAKFKAEKMLQRRALPRLEVVA